MNTSRFKWKNNGLLTSGTATVRISKLSPYTKPLIFAESLEQREIQIPGVCCQHSYLQLSMWSEGQRRGGVSLPPLPCSAHLPNTGWHSLDPEVRVHRGTLPFPWQETAGAVKARRLLWADLWSSLLRWVPWRAGPAWWSGAACSLPRTQAGICGIRTQAVKNHWVQSLRQRGGGGGTKREPKKKEASA